MKSSSVKNSDIAYTSRNSGRKPLGSGSSYGIGQPPKVGKLRSSYMVAGKLPKIQKKPPKSIK